MKNPKQIRIIEFFDINGKPLMGSDSAHYIYDGRIKRDDTIYMIARNQTHRLKNVTKKIAGYRIRYGQHNRPNARYSEPVYFYNGHLDWMPEVDTSFDNC